MKIKDFYAYVKQARKTELDEVKREICQDVYQFMWECGATKSGVLELIERRKARAEWDTKITQVHIEHYEYLKKILIGVIPPDTTTNILAANEASA